MPKPIHEQEWNINALSEVINAEGDSIAIILHHGAARPIVAVPKLIHALRMWLMEDGHTVECGSALNDESACSLECSATRTALRDAGGLP